jgi:hypothetical protein
MLNARIKSQAAAVMLLAALAGCSANQPVTYAGDLTPTAGTCDPPARAVLIRRGHYVQFTPRQGVLILDGQVAPGGRISAEADRPGADGKPYRLLLQAALAGPAITGSYVTPRCRYAVKLAESP